MQGNPHIAKIYVQSLKMLFIVLALNALAAIIISLHVSDACTLARYQPVYSGWPPNESFVAIDSLLNRQLCMTIIFRSLLGVTLLIWLVVSVAKLSRHLSSRVDPVLWIILFGVAALTYFASGIPAIPGLHFYRTGIEDWWPVGSLKSAILIVPFYVCLNILIYISLCAIRKLSS